MQRVAKLSDAVAKRTEAAAKPATPLEQNLRPGIEPQRHDQPGDRARIGMLGPGAAQAIEPAAIDNHVVVKEGDHLAPSLRDRAVAREIEAGHGLAHIGYPRIGRAQLRGPLVGRRVVDHEQLERRLRLEREQ